MMFCEKCRCYFVPVENNIGCPHCDVIREETQEELDYIYSQRRPTSDEVDEFMEMDVMDCD